MAARKVFEGFGYADGARAVAPFLVPRTGEEVAGIFARASESGSRVCLRGNGRSYGDAALTERGVVLDMRHMKRVLSFDTDAGVIEVEPGVTVNELWQIGLPHGFWPAVVPGTGHPTVGGLLAMNVHGKNHYKMGGTGDHVLDFDLATPSGQLLTCSREENAELFHAVIGGFGMLGCTTRIRIKMKRVYSGSLRVWQWSTPSLAGQFEAFEQCLDDDYFVSWVDCVNGSAPGQGQLHRARYVPQGEDPNPDFAVEGQSFPKTMMGVPLPLVPQVLKVFYTSNLAVGFTNQLKYLASRFGSTAEYRQNHAAFHFLLDQMVGFRDAYAPHGFIQYQPFVPRENAPRVFSEILKRCKQRGIVSYLGVLKRYREDDFLLSHALDGYSLALDFPAKDPGMVPLMHELSDLVVEAGGRFYPAKDLVIRPDHFRRSLGQGPLEQFQALRRRVDPQRVLHTRLAERIGLDDSE